MNYEESLKHNVECWKNKIAIIDRDIEFMKGRKEALTDAVASLEIIIKEQKRKQ